MMADDAEIDEEIERQLEADARERDYVEEPLLNDRELDVNKSLFFFLFSSTSIDKFRLLSSKRKDQRE